jgi:hypothetical protein
MTRNRPKRPPALGLPPALQPTPPGLSVKLLKNHVGSSVDRTRRQLQGELEGLRLNLDRAIRNLENDQRLDSHLIQNAGQATALIAVWNLLQDLGPVVENLDACSVRQSDHAETSEKPGV